MDSLFFKVISAIANVITIVLFSYGIIFALFKRTKSVIGFQVNQFMIKSFRLGVIMIIGILSFRFSELLYVLLLVMLKGSATSDSYFWETGKEIQHLVAYFITLTIMLPVFWMIASTTWTLSFKYITDFINVLLPIRWHIKIQDKPVLQILHAEYGTDKDNIDVTDKLRAMINNNSLTITSSNDLAGDPHYGVVKTLTVEYRFDNKIFIEKILENETKKIP